MAVKVEKKALEAAVKDLNEVCGFDPPIAGDEDKLISKIVEAAGDIRPTDPLKSTTWEVLEAVAGVKRPENKKGKVAPKKEEPKEVKKEAKPEGKKPVKAPVAPAKAEKAPAKKVAGPKAPGKRDEWYASKIKILAKENPKKKGSIRYKRFAKYVEGMTVKEALKKGVRARDIRTDSAHGFIKVG